MSKAYPLHEYLNIIKKCESRSFHSYRHEQSNKKLRRQANPRQYHYFTYIEGILGNYDADDQIVIQANGDYGVRRNGTEVGYGRIDLHLVSNPCYPKYSKIL